MHYIVVFLSLVSATLSHAVTSPKPIPWLRLHGEAHNLKIDKKNRSIAFTDIEGKNLSVLVLREHKIYRLTKQQTGMSFFFSPDGFRIFYRELLKKPNGQVESVVKAYDIASSRVIEIDRFKGLSGYLTLDPRDYRFQLMHDKGILSKMIIFPDERLARWQLAQRTESGKFLAAPKGLMWLTHSGFTMRRLADDGAELQSFSLSPDGSSAVWATKKARIYFSQMGAKPKLIGRGFDPVFHPRKPYIVYAGIRTLGTRIIDTDLRLSDRSGQGKWLTFTQSAKERWPRWTADGRHLIYSIAKTTDIYRLDLRL